MNSKNWERFTQRARKVLSLAQEEAERQRARHSFGRAAQPLPLRIFVEFHQQRADQLGDPRRINLFSLHAATVPQPFCELKP